LPTYSDKYFYYSSAWRIYNWVIYQATDTETCSKRKRRAANNRRRLFSRTCFGRFHERGPPVYSTYTFAAFVPPSLFRPLTNISPTLSRLLFVVGGCPEVWLKNAPGSPTRSDIEQKKKLALRRYPNGVENNRVRFCASIAIRFYLPGAIFKGASAGTRGGRYSYARISRRNSHLPARACVTFARLIAAAAADTVWVNSDDGRVSVSPLTFSPRFLLLTVPARGPLVRSFSRHFTTPKLLHLALLSHPATADPPPPTRHRATTLSLRRLFILV